MKKTLFTIILLTQSLAFAATETVEQSKPATDLATCSFESGEVGKLRFRGETREIAFDRTSKACLQARVQYYQVQRGSAPSQERQILFAEDCVNNTYCKR